MAGFDIASMKDLGMGVIALFFLYMIIRSQMSTHKESMVLQVQQQEATNKVVQDNTKVINKLANTLEKGNLLEEDFRRRLLEETNESKTLLLGIQDKVDDIHEKVV